MLLLLFVIPAVVVGAADVDAIVVVVFCCRFRLWLLLLLLLFVIPAVVVGAVDVDAVAVVVFS